jgi:hypothetical protein
MRTFEATHWIRGPFCDLRNFSVSVVLMTGLDLPGYAGGEEAKHLHTIFDILRQFDNY